MPDEFSDLDPIFHQWNAAARKILSQPKNQAEDDKLNQELLPLLKQYSEIVAEHGFDSTVAHLAYEELSKKHQSFAPAARSLITLAAQIKIDLIRLLRRREQDERSDPRTT